VVEEIKLSEDGHVRAACVKYTNPNESAFRTSWRPIQKLVVIVPRGDLNAMEAVAVGHEPPHVNPEGNQDEVWYDAAESLPSTDHAGKPATGTLDEG
jgi:hypothetical protein